MRHNFLLLILIGAMAVVSCEKQETEIPPTVAQFTASTNTGSYFIQNSPNSVFKIPVGFTTVSSAPRTINYTVTSPTGARAGVQYNIPSAGSITIPAGQTVDSIVVNGLFAGYPAGRKDTLLFKITGGDGAPASWSNSYTLIMQKFCPVDISTFKGDYKNTRETFGASPYGPYTTTVTTVTPISATKARIAVTNIWDAGWGPIEFELDWTNPENYKVLTIAKSAGIADAGTLDPGYAGEQVAVRPFAGNDGTFSSCDGTITLRMQLGVAGLGYFGELYTVTMAR
jgi:hypothetical protein